MVSFPSSSLSRSVPFPGYPPLVDSLVAQGDGFGLRLTNSNEHLDKSDIR